MANVVASASVPDAGGGLPADAPDVTVVTDFVALAHAVVGSG
jgi:hypothetical protein